MIGPVLSHRQTFRVLLALSLAAASCASSNERLYKQAASTATYYQASYQHRCQNTGGKFPPECVPCEATLAKAAWQVRTAETNVAIGYMDPKEITELKALITELQSCP